MVVNSTISNLAFFEFLMANYYANYYRKINLTKADYENILSFLQAGHGISNDFIYSASREAQLYCLRYSLFCDYEPTMVQSLIDKKDPNIDIILEKYSTNDIIRKINRKGVYGVILSDYSCNYERQMQTLSFQDYNIMCLCMQLTESIDFPEEDIDTVFLKESLLSIIPDALKEKVKVYLKYYDYDSIIEILKNVKSNCNNDDRLYTFNTKKIYTFPWEEKVRKVFENNAEASGFFTDLCDEVTGEDAMHKITYAQKCLSLF